jgi:uncharacterized protein with HEPN domain
VSRRRVARLEDVLAAVEAIRGSHRPRGAHRRSRLRRRARPAHRIGEAIKDLPAELLATEPDIPWQDIARMRDRLAHRYFDTSHAIVAATVTNDLPLLEAAVGRITLRLASS